MEVQFALSQRKRSKATNLAHLVVETLTRCSKPFAPLGLDIVLASTTRGFPESTFSSVTVGVPADIQKSPAYAAGTNGRE